MKRSRLIAMLVALVMLMGILVACVQPEDDAPVTPPPETSDAQAPEDDGNDDNGDVDEAAAPPVAAVTTQDTLTVLTMSLPVGFIPWTVNDVPSFEAQRLMFDRLFVLDYDTNVPDPALGLAINWYQPNARTTNIELRRGVYFHNGDPLTAYDVVFTLDQLRVAPAGMPTFGMIESVVAHDDFNLTVYTEMDFVPIIAHLSQVRGSIINARLFQEIGEEAFNAHPIGSGAWKFYQIILGDRVEYVANPDYWGGAPLLSRVIVRAVPEASVRLMEIQAGTADIATHLAPIDVPLAEADPNVNVVRALNTSSNFIGFNMNAPHLNNILVRQAINYAIDVDAIVQTVWLGEFVPLHAPITPLV